MIKYEDFSKYIDKSLWHNSEELDELFRKYLNTQDKSIKDKIILAHLSLVSDIANHFTGYLKPRGSLELDDLIQEGRIGLMRGIDHYDPNKEGRNFLSYMTLWIKQSILKSIADHNKTIRLPVNQIVKAQRLRTESDLYQEEHGKKPTVEQLADITSMSLDAIAEVLQFSDPISLDWKYRDDGDEFGAFLVDNRAEEHEKKLEKREMAKESLQEMLRKTNLTRKTRLTPREEEMYYRRYGLNGFIGNLTEKELAKAYDITHQRVHQILQKIKRKVRMANGLIPDRESTKS
jgi:RNA polymerase primary sigma factor